MLYSESPFSLPAFVFFCFFFRNPDDWNLRSWWGTKSRVWAWGHNNRGQLGDVDGARVKSPTLCESVSDLQPVSIVGGEQCLITLTKDGQVGEYVCACISVCQWYYCWGSQVNCKWIT